MISTLLFFFFYVYLFWERERKRERKSTRWGGTEREGDTESEAGSRRRAVSTEPVVRLEPTNCEIMTWAEVGRSTDWATQAPRQHWDSRTCGFRKWAPGCNEIWVVKCWRLATVHISIPPPKTANKMRNCQNVSWGTRVAQLVEQPTLDFTSGHDLTVMRSSPTSGSVLSVEPACDSLSPSLSAPPPLLLCLSLSQR